MLVIAIKNDPSIDDFTIKHGGYDGLWLYMAIEHGPFIMLAT
jgi:hypothetical protein